MNQQSHLDWSLIDQLRRQNPVVLTIANSVTPGKVADAVSAAGASPVMSKEKAEAAEMNTIASAITINIGTVTVQQLSLIRATLDANAGRLPVVLDPVAIGSIKYRLQIVQQLLQDYHFSVIRGNAGEIAALVGDSWNAHGIDAGSGQGDLEQIARQCARQYYCCVVLTGEVDVVTDGEHLMKNTLSSPYFAQNVGSGDMLSSIVAAYLGLGGDAFQASAVATKMFSIAGIKAAQQVTGFGSWQGQFLDQLAQLTTARVKDFMKEDE